MESVLGMLRFEPEDPARERAIEARAASRRDALEGFLRAVERRALTMLELSTRDREEALDLLQDAMLRFCRRYAGHAQDEWPPLFFRVLQNALVDWQRRRGVRERLLGWWQRLRTARDGVETDALAELPDPGPAPDQRLGCGEFSRDLQRALAALPLRQRQAFLLRQWQGLSVAEAAAALGVSEGSIKTHLFRAQAALREALREHA